MSGIKTFSDSFDSFNQDDWYASDFVLAASWNQTGWDETYVTTTTPGEVTLTFDGADLEDKPFTGSQIQSNEFYGYGTYEVEMIASDVSGVVSSFFLFTSDFFGATQHNEIDIEFLGGDTTVMNVNYYYGTNQLGSNGSVQIPLGFDAAESMHTYRIEWQPDAIRWFADDALIYEVDGETAAVAIPDEQMRAFANIWTGAEGLQSWHGPIDENATAQASYSSISYTPYTLGLSQVGGDAISFAGLTDGLVLDMEAGTYAAAIRVMALGDSLSLGAVDTTNPAELDALREGFRLDLFEHILAGGGWIDYVGGLNNGPDAFLDRDHQGIGGKHLSVIVDDSTGASDLSESIVDYTPDIVLFMAGTNDYYNNGDQYFFETDLPSIVADTAKAANQFYADPANADRYLVISTLPPKAKGGVSPEYALFLNEGYSIVGGQYVRGDASNGTFVPGIIDTVISLQSVYPNLIIFENPLTEPSDLSLDLIHITELGYQKYAAALFATLEAEIGITGGTFGVPSEILPTVVEITGGEGGDRIGGDAGANVLNGGGGNDFLEGRGGADTLSGGEGTDMFAFGLDALDGTTDTIVDYDSTQGDIISLGAIIDSYGWTEAEIAANVTITDTPAGAEISIATPLGTFSVAIVAGTLAADVVLATTQFTQVFELPEELLGTANNDELWDVQEGRAIFGFAGDDDIYGLGGDDILTGGTGRDRLSGGAGQDTFRYEVGDLEDRDTILDFSIADGDQIDLSAIGTAYGWSAAELMSKLVLSDNNARAEMRLGVVIEDITKNFVVVRNMDKDTFLAGNSLILDAGPAPDTGDDDGNLALLVPDAQIDAAEAGAVIVTVSGLDADATAVVTLTAGAVTLSQSAALDGDLIFDLNTLPDGPVTTSVIATDAGGNTATVGGPVITLAITPDLSADEDGNLTVIPADLAISDVDAAAVGIDVTGIDADATGIVTVTDSLGGEVTGGIATDGRVTLDLRSLTDGLLSVSVTVTDTTGNTATVTAAQTPVLDQATDTSADIDGNLAVVAPDTAITLGEETAVVFTISGIDGDATAVVTVSDGATTLTSIARASDGDVVMDLSGLTDGPLTVSVLATDATGNTANVNGPALSLDTTDTPLPFYPEPTITGTELTDAIDGTGAVDVIAGLGGDDVLKGRAGDDWLIGGAGNDKLVAGDGNDVLVGGLGADILNGNAGADRFLIDLADLDGSVDDVKDFNPTEGDLIELRDLVPAGLNPSEIASYLRIFKSGTLGLLQYDALGTGLDYTTIAEIRSGGNFTVDGLIASGGLELTYSPAGSLVGTEINDTLEDGNDSSAIYGLGGDDWLIGNGGQDVIYGGNGDDVLDGGAGSDILSGQAGADTFVFTPESLDGTRDRIDDFNADVEGDQIDLREIVSDFGWTALEASSYIAFSAYSGGVYLSVSAPEVVQDLVDLRNITTADITFDDILLF
jgi:Ca2+-binding RTX toxin-like protein